VELNKQDKSMFDKAKLEEEYTDSVWRLIMYDYAEAKGEEYLKENEEVENDLRYAPTPEATERFNKMINSFFHKRKLQTLAIKSRKILNKVAIGFLVFAVIFTITYISVDAFRVQVLNFLLTSEKEYTSVQLEESELGKNITAGLSDIYAPSYIPMGYWLDSIMDIENGRIIEYINNESKIIRFIENTSSWISNIDTEDAEMVKSININGVDGLFVLKDGKTTISWAMDNKMFVISAQISEDEIVQIAESVIFIK